MGEMLEPRVVVDVQMREHDAFDVARSDAERAQLRPDLLLRLDAERNSQRR